MSEASKLNKLISTYEQQLHAASVARKSAEESFAQILELVAYEPEGVATTVTDEYEVKVTGKLNRTLDEKEYKKIRGSLSMKEDPVVMKPSLDLRKFRALETLNPDAFQLVTRCVTVKAGKPSISIKRKED